MACRSLIAGVVLVATGLHAMPPQAHRDHAVDLARGFLVPPVQARLSCFWWWLNGNVTKEAISRDLEEMKAKDSVACCCTTQAVQRNWGTLLYRPVQRSGAMLRATLPPRRA